MKISIVGDTYTVTSSITVSDIELLQKVNPAALKIVDKDNNTLFSICFKQGASSISQYGIVFGGKTRTSDERCVCTGSVPASAASADAAKNYVADVVGVAANYLETLEKSVAEAVKKAKDAKTALVGKINYVAE